MTRNGVSAVMDEHERGKRVAESSSLSTKVVYRNIMIASVLHPSDLQNCRLPTRNWMEEYCRMNVTAANYLLYAQPLFGKSRILENLLAS